MLKLLYFSGDHCSVCKALKPKLFDAITESYPNLDIEVVNIGLSPEIAAQHLVFTLPVLLIMLDDKEQYRFVRSFSVSEVIEKLKRINLLYENN